MTGATDLLRELRESVGDGPLGLACHAAVPVVVDAPLLNLIRVNFFLDPDDPLPYEAEAELLLSPLFREIGEGLYEIDPDLRNILLASLNFSYGHDRARQVATLLEQYTDATSAWRFLPSLEAAQRLTAVSLIDPEAATRWLEESKTGRGTSQAKLPREWYVAMHRRAAERSRVSEIEEVLAGRAPTPYPPDAVLVEGTLCPRGHFTDPAAQYCRECGISIVQMTLPILKRPRPPLGVLLRDDGTGFTLDKDFVVGREPVLDEDVATGRARPLLIPDPGGAVSRLHLRISLIGWQVEVRDLYSSNGLVLHMPNGAEQRLLPGDAEIIQPGTKIVFGDRHLQYLSYRHVEPEVSSPRLTWQGDLLEATAEDQAFEFERSTMLDELRLGELREAKTERQAPSSWNPPDRYELVQALQQGPFGMVYRARDLNLDRDVALKLLAPRLNDDPAFREQFLREAELAGRIKHPGIQAVHEVNSHDGRMFMVMEFVDGVTLHELMSRHPGSFSIEQVLVIGTQIADVLADIHQHGIVHRDVKPENILVQADGQLKIGDFGVAEEVYSQVPVAGTPLFMAPEQWGGGAVTPKMDLYALGCLLYEMLTGEPPFRGRLTELQDQHLTLAPVPPRDRNRKVPVALNDLVLALLAKNPADRPASARDVVHTLRKIGNSLDRPRLFRGPRFAK